MKPYVDPVEAYYRLRMRYQQLGRQTAIQQAMEMEGDLMRVQLLAATGASFIEVCEQLNCSPSEIAELFVVHQC